ncbi:MAG: CcoQ/FixQ family Cbb3-type cytochrome c oxidase assembly chaperone [Bacteroidetes bacterium]|nr:CcoQ/FixQ family Cbb3-type cytochrome c oxidase assembly chaperone [Bacteroidota bacterium]
MKFINYLESITGIGIYPLLSLMIFFLFFAAVTWRVIRANKEYINEVKNIPLDHNEK